MKFVLEVNLPDDSDVNAELSRILRDCGDEIADLTELEPGDKQEILDSHSARVGHWHVAADAE
ncbi:hypothetical protein JRC04_00940 [Mycolicibacterium sp. S2-37]|uniref:hypothetical protein n=1 Tax=Mycolicibacterium sp. S2-37 TaxID=2810297 RepID=UPI001A9452A5|nr:hypothetical protein [Mycolicibacterium sp. S2-37]MBO0676021.1 hypothetical protein [Mycolicibacterium sp. S2-37]